MNNAIKTANIYFHAQHAEAAVELGARVTADHQGQVVCTRTDAAFVRERKDCGGCDTILLDTALGAEKTKLILDAHDAMQHPYDVVYVRYDVDTKLYNLVKDDTHDQATHHPDPTPDEKAAAEANARFTGAINADGGHAVAGTGRGRRGAAGRAAGG